jgi:hypothetical protein
LIVSPKCFLTDAIANDVVLVRNLKTKSNDAAKPILSTPLKPEGKLRISHGDSIDHDSLIGRQIRDAVPTLERGLYRIHQPSLAEYVKLSPRIVTPVGIFIQYSALGSSLIWSK